MVSLKDYFQKHLLLIKLPVIYLRNGLTGLVYQLML